MTSFYLLCLVVAWIMAALMLVENNRLRAENETLRDERDSATAAATELWGTINRAADDR